MLFPPVIHNFRYKASVEHDNEYQYETEVVYHGGHHRIKKFKTLYSLTNKCPGGHNNLDYWYLLCKYGPDTYNFDGFFTSWMKKLIKMRKLKT